MRSHRAPVAVEPAQVEEPLRSYFPAPHGAAVVAAWLFGSHGEKRAHLESDVDVGVLLDRRLLPTAAQRFDLRLRLTSDLIHALGRNEVDLVVLNDAPAVPGPQDPAHRHRALLQRSRPESRLPPRRSDPGCGPRAVPRAVPADDARRTRQMTFLVERLSELNKHLDSQTSATPVREGEPLDGRESDSRGLPHGDAVPSRRRRRPTRRFPAGGVRRRGDGTHPQPGRPDRARRGRHRRLDTS